MAELRMSPPRIRDLEVGGGAHACTVLYCCRATGRSVSLGAGFWLLASVPGCALLCINLLQQLGMHCWGCLKVANNLLRC
jgi:hypothetical protein